MANEYSSFFSGMNSSGNSINLSDYSMIKNGTYKKLMKAYYKNEKAEKESSSTDTQKTSQLLQGHADNLKKSASALLEEELWEKKTKTAVGEDGKETTTTDYDWDAIVGAVKRFAEDYNSMLKEAGESKNNSVLRSSVWMVNMTAKSAGLLEDVGITIGKDNALTVDETKLKAADFSVIRTLFSGYGSYAGRIVQKAGSIGIAAGKNTATYTSNATYSKTLASLVSGKIDEEA